MFATGNVAMLQCWGDPVVVGRGRIVPYSTYCTVQYVLSRTVRTRVAADPACPSNVGNCAAGKAHTHASVSPPEAAGHELNSRGKICWKTTPATLV